MAGLFPVELNEEVCGAESDKNVPEQFDTFLDDPIVYRVIIFRHHFLPKTAGAE